MLTREENDLVTRIGPGTPMGNLIRQFWIPALVSAELAEPDGTPVRIMLLGEQLIAFRDSDGRVGLLANNCPHRGASLFFGRNEEAGLRCVYHGWKFNARGECVDMPNEPAESDFKQKVSAVAYPTQERSGIVWAYMGPRSEPPPLPNLIANVLPGKHLDIRVNQLACNWLQVLEGSIDQTHGGFLHNGSILPEEAPDGSIARYDLLDRAGVSYVLDSEGGVTYALRRRAGPDQHLWHILQFMLPIFTMATGDLGPTTRFVARVPMDDEHTLQYFVQIVDDETSFEALQRRLTDRGPNYALEAFEPDAYGQVPNSSEWFGRFRRVASSDNDYLIDRTVQRSNRGQSGYTGVDGFVDQDALVTVSMGTIYDRTNERLGSTDSMIIRVRRRLIDAARALATQGIVPVGVDNPDVYRVRAGSVILPADVDWMEGTRDSRVDTRSVPVAYT